MTSDTDELIAYHGAITAAMTAERTTLESGLIPVTAYILVAAAEAVSRWPAMVEAIDDAMPFEEIGLAARAPGQRVDAVHLWSLANIFLVGRQFLRPHGLGPDDAATAKVLDAWERAALAYHGGHRQAWDVDMRVTPFDDDTVELLLDGVETVSDMVRPTIRSFSASLTAHLFLQYFDTRVGTRDTGPYDLSGDRTLVVREWFLDPGDQWWAPSLDGVSHRHLVAGLVLDRVEVKVDDWGTTRSVPDDHLERVVGVSLATADTTGGGLQPVDLEEIGPIVKAVRASQARLYRDIAAMSRAEKVRCGASVYFGFLRPFAEVAGVAGELDWTVPRDTVTSGVYPLLEAVEGGDVGEERTDGSPYYDPLDH